MSDFKETQHGRNHRPGGSDPIPGLSGIRFGVENVGSYLHVETTSGDVKFKLAVETFFEVRNSFGGLIASIYEADGSYTYNGSGPADISYDSLSLSVSNSIVVSATDMKFSSSELAFFGVTPVTQRATPVTLGNVIALLQAYGLAA